MKRQKLALVTLLPLLVSLGDVGWASAAVSWNHDPGSSIGPPNWGALDPAFELCESGASQSPVDISGATTGGGPSLRFSYPDNELIVENTGHVIEVQIPVDNGNTLWVGRGAFRLVQYHFHAPSEHTLNGRQFDLEAHLVHENAGGQLAVVGVFMDIGQPGNELVDDVLHGAPEEAGEETDLGIETNAKGLLPGFGSRPGNGPFVISRYYTYSGSLTTPACSEPVRWIVLKEPVTVSESSVEELHRLVSLFPGYGGYPDNNRPIQPLNGRQITSRG
jgi:carbonic anhydrase